ncbi:MAG: hypothetical protein QXL94_01615, partial [Candidatus Parvarchaeum sp.]
MIDIKMIGRINSESFDELEGSFPYSYAKKNLRNYIKLRDTNWAAWSSDRNNSFRINMYSLYIDGSLAVLFSKIKKSKTHTSNTPVVQYVFKKDMVGTYTIVPDSFLNYTSVINGIFLISRTDESVRRERTNGNLWREKIGLFPSKELFE